MKLSAHKVVFPKLAEEDAQLSSESHTLARILALPKKTLNVYGNGLNMTIIKGTAAPKAQLSGAFPFYNGLHGIRPKRSTLPRLWEPHPLQEETPSYRGEVPLPFLTAFRRQVSGRCYRPPQPGHPPPLG